MGEQPSRSESSNKKLEMNLFKITIMVIICALFGIELVIASIYFMLNRSGTSKEIDTLQIIIIGMSLFSFFYFIIANFCYLHKRHIGNLRNILLFHVLILVFKIIVYICLLVYLNKSSIESKTTFDFVRYQSISFLILNFIYFLISVFGKYDTYFK